MNQLQDLVTRMHEDDLRHVRKYAEAYALDRARASVHGLKTTREGMEAIDLATACGDELIRRRTEQEKRANAGPDAVCWESNPDGSAPQKLSFSVLVF